MDPGKTITRNFVALFAGRVVTAGAAVVATLILARTLDAADFGHYSLLVALLTVAAALVDFGGNAIAAREIARGTEAPGRVLAVLFRARLLLAVVAVVAASAYVAAAVPAESRLVLGLGLLGILPLAFNGADAWFQASGRMELSVFPRSTIQMAWIAALAALAASGSLGLESAVLLRVGAAALAACLVGAIAVRQVRPLRRPRPGGLGRFLRASAPVGVAGFITMLYFHLDTMMLEVYRGASEVAIYQAAYRLFGFGTTVLGMIVFPFFPFLSRLHGTDRIAFRRMLGRALFAVALFAVPPATAGAILAPGTVEGFYGDGYAASAAPLRFLMGSLVAVGAGIVGSTALIAAERQKTWLAIAAVGLLANAVANALVLPRFGAAGAAATTLGTEAWVAVAAFAAIARRDGPVIRVEDIVRVAAVAAVVAAGAFLLRDRSIWMAGAVLGPVFLLLAALVSRGLRPGRDRG